MAKLGRDTFIESFGHLHTIEDLNVLLGRHCLSRWSDELRDPRCRTRVAFADGKAVAYVKIGPPTRERELTGKVMELRQLYVLKSWQGRGVAQGLMQWGIDAAFAEGAETLSLFVFTHNVRARRFYERYGFVDAGPRNFVVGSVRGQDRLYQLALPKRG